MIKHCHPMPFCSSRIVSLMPLYPAPPVIGKYFILSLFDKSDLHFVWNSKANVMDRSIPIKGKSKSHDLAANRVKARIMYTLEQFKKLLGCDANIFEYLP